MSGDGVGRMHELPPDRGHVASEGRNLRTTDLHHRDPAGLVAAIQREDRLVCDAVEAAAGAIAAFISAVEPGFLVGGRLIYLGAGTSGRLGVLDAAEIPPTFQAPPGRVIGLIAGGDAALRRSSEGLEDDPHGAVPALRDLELQPTDAVLGIAAGGTTPYARGGVAWAAARPRPPVTGFLTCSPVAAPVGCGHLLVVETGPEVVTGSTRMKAGTATKLILNTISTALMVRAGRVHGNLMVDVRASNAKLRDRAARIVVALTGLERAAAFALLDRAGGAVKTAVVMQLCGSDRAAAEERLARCHGRLDRALASTDDHSPR